MGLDSTQRWSPDHFVRSKGLVAQLKHCLAGKMSGFRRPTRAKMVRLAISVGDCVAFATRDK